MKYIVALMIGIVCLSCSQDKKISSSDDQRIAIISSDTIELIASGDRMSDIKFNLDIITVPALKAITIKLTNTSSDATMPHNVVFIEKGKANEVGQNGLKHRDNGFVKPNDLNVIAYSELAQIGETRYVTFKSPKRGEYEFICSYPGHWGLMKGTFRTQ